MQLRQLPRLLQVQQSKGQGEHDSGEPAMKNRGWHAEQSEGEEQLLQLLRQAPAVVALVS